MRRLFLALLVMALILPIRPAGAGAFGDETPQAANFGGDNAQLRDMLALQYQMQLLKRLIEREKAANNMIQAALNVGVSGPAIPLPDRALCEQVPANMPCADAYKGLYADYTAAPAKLTPLPAPIPQPSANPALLAEVKDDIVEQVMLSSFYWTDITCLQDRCSAVISPDPANPMSRYRVSVGEVLPDGGVISAITAAGVTMTRGEKQIHLDPAPAA